MKIHMKNDIKTYIVTALAMAALSVPPVVLSEWMGASGKGYSAVLSYKQDIEKEGIADPGTGEKSKTELKKEKTLYSIGKDHIRRVGSHIYGFWQSFEYVPSLTEYNLAYLFPIMSRAEKEIEGDIQNSAGDLLVQGFLQKLSRLGPELHQKSVGAELFEELNEKEQNWMHRIYQELNHLPYRTGIRFRFLNGDGKESAEYSNTKEILALTNVYSYFHQWDHVQSTETYALKLWEASHRYDISIGSVYYCDGCEETDEEDETEFVPSQVKTAEPEEEQKDIEKQVQGRTEESADVSQTQTAESSPALEASGPGSSSNLPDASSQPSESLEPVSQEETASAAESVSTSEVSDQTMQTAETVPADSKEESEAVGETETVPENSSDSGSSDFSVCPGHVDVVVTITVTGLNEQKNLFSLAASIQETEEEKAVSANNGWSGWTEEAQTAARELASQDWEAKYGLKSEEMSFGRTLTKQELEAHMALLPEDISPERRELIACALDSVGKIPYHFGGKASRPGYTGNQFFSVTEPDQMGRTLKGLDCSGWINWVYWSALGTPVTSGGTSSLAASGVEIPREELKPGDIAVVPGDEAHVVMFLGWDPATGKMICIHESAGKTNNVTVSLSDRSWTHYRKILE